MLTMSRRDFLRNPNLKMNIEECFASFMSMVEVWENPSVHRCARSLEDVASNGTIWANLANALNVVEVKRGGSRLISFDGEMPKEETSDPPWIGVLLRISPKETQYAAIP